MGLSLAIAALFLTQTPRPPDEDVDRLLRRLGSEVIEERQAAEQKLRAVGSRALPALEQSARSQDAEVAGRARRLLEVITVRSTLSPRLLRAFPDLDLRLAGKSDESWTSEMLRILSECWQENDLEGLHAWDLEPIVGRAFRGCRDDKERKRLIDASRALRLSRAFPEIVAIAEGDPDIRGRVLLPAVRALLPTGGSKAIPVLLRLLETPTHPLRMEILQELRDVHHGVPAKALRNLLADPDDFVRSEAAQILGLKRDPDSRESLEAALKDVDESVREEAVKALGWLWDERSLPPLRASLGDEGPSVRGAAALVLGEFRDVESGARIEALLEEKGWWEVTQAAQALALLDRREAIPALLRAAERPDAHIRKAVLAALFRLGARKEAVQLSRSMLSSNDRFAAGYAAELCLETETREVLPSLLAAIVKKGESRALPQAFARLSGPEDIPALRRHLSAPHPWVRSECLRGLSLKNAQDVRQDVEKLLDDTSDNVRAEALKTLARIGAPESSEAVARRLSDPTHYVAWEAVRTLTRLKGQEPDKAVRAFLARSPTTGMLRAAAALVQRGGLPVARELLKDPRPRVRAGALDGLRDVGLRLGWEELLTALDDPDAEVRSQAIWTAGVLREKIAPDRLRSLLEDPNAGVVQDAVSLVGRLDLSEELPRVEALLGSDDSGTVREALQVIAWRGGPEYFELLRRWAFRSEALGESIVTGLRWRTDDGFRELLEQLLLHDETTVRHRAALALADRGSNLGVPSIFEVGIEFQELNALRAPDLYRRLKNAPSVGEHRGTPLKLLQRAARAAGLEFEIPTPAPGILGYTLHDPDDLAEFNPRRNLLEDLQVAALQFELVLEPNRVRLLGRDEARRFWSRWWSRHHASR